MKWYEKLPPWGKLLVAPLLGASFALFLPFVGIVLALEALWIKVRGWCGGR